eukprot:Gb_34398 [translate_table: standard]
MLVSNNVPLQGKMLDCRKGFSEMHKVVLDATGRPDENLLVEITGGLHPARSETSPHDLFKTKASLSLQKGQLRTSIYFQPGFSASLEVRHLQLDELELASLRGMVQKNPASANPWNLHQVESNKSISAKEPVVGDIDQHSTLSTWQIGRYPYVPTHKNAKGFIRHNGTLPLSYVIGCPPFTFFIVDLGVYLAFDINDLGTITYLASTGDLGVCLTFLIGDIGESIRNG